LTVPKAEVERLKEAGVPFTIHKGPEPQPPEPSAPGSPYVVEIIDNLMTVFDAEGHGVACHVLIDRQAAKMQLDTWRSQYTFDYADAIASLEDYFESLN
jgi:hypothetical protein